MVVLFFKCLYACDVRVCWRLRAQMRDGRSPRLLTACAVRAACEKESKRRVKTGLDEGRDKA